MNILTASELGVAELRAEIRAEIANISHEIEKIESVQKYDNQPVQKYDTQSDNISQYEPDQKPENIDNQKNCEPAGDTKCHKGRSQYGISRTDLTQRPCAEGKPRGISHEQRGQLAAALAGEWMAFGPGGDSVGGVFFQGLHVYEPGADSPFVQFIDIALDGSLVYQCDGERVLAWLDDDTLTWDDGDVYRRVPVRAPICDLSSNITTTTAEEQYRTFNQEELAEELHTDGLDSGQEPPSSQEELFTVRGLLILPGFLTTEQSFTVKDEPFTVDDYNASDVTDKNDAIVTTESDTDINIIGYNCGYYYNCDYWYEYDIRDETMEVKSGTRLASASHLSPCKALLRAGDFVFTGQPPGG